MFYYDRVIGNDDVENEARSVSDFEEITHTGSFNVYVKQDSIFDLEVEADENLLPYIETYVRGDELIIEPEDHKNLVSDNPINVFVRLPVLEKIKLTGSGSIETDYFNCNENNLYIKLTGSGKIHFDADADFTDITNTGSGDVEGKLYTDQVNIEITGSGEVELEGEAGESDYLITGSGDIRTFGIKHNNNTSRITGSGNIFLNVDNELDVEITGSGNLFYKGTPDIKKQITGTGNIRDYNK